PVRGAAGTRVICFFAVLARPRHLVPAPGSLGIERRYDVVSFGPGEFLSRSEAAAVPPALFRAQAAAGVVHAGIGLALVLVRRSGQGETGGGSQVSDEGQAGEEPARPEPPEMVPARPEHDQSARCTTLRSSPGIYCR